MQLLACGIAKDSTQCQYDNGCSGSAKRCSHGNDLFAHIIKSTTPDRGETSP